MEVESLSQAFHFPAGRPAGAEPAERLGLEAEVERGGDGALRLRLRCRRFAYGLRVAAPGLLPEDDAFSLEPGGERTIALRSAEAESTTRQIAITALNLQGRVTVPIQA